MINLNDSPIENHKTICRQLAALVTGWLYAGWADGYYMFNTKVGHESYKEMLMLTEDLTEENFKFMVANELSRIEGFEYE